MTVKLFIAATLDGYIADKNEGLDWLFAADEAGGSAYESFYAGIDTIVMGRRTFDWICQHEKIWPYAGKMCYVLTHQKLETADFIDSSEFIESVTADRLAELLQNQATSQQSIWLVGGGELIRLFLEKNWLDALQISLAPVLLGRGIRLFPPGNYGAQLELLGARTFGEFVEVEYLVKK